MDNKDNTMNDFNTLHISEDSFRINKYDFTETPFVDIVTTSAPFFHFQLLEPKNDEERSGAIKYFKENKKLYISFVDASTLILYIGCTEGIYIRSSINNDFDIEQLKSAITDVSRWYQVFGKNRISNLSE